MWVHTSALLQADHATNKKAIEWFRLENAGNYEIKWASI